MALMTLSQNSGTALFQFNKNDEMDDLPIGWMLIPLLNAVDPPDPRSVINSPLQPGRIVARQLTPNLGGPTEESAKKMIRDQLLLITKEESLQLFTTYICI